MNQPGFNVMSGKGFEGCSSRGFFSDHDMPTCKAHQAKPGHGGKRMGGYVFRGILKEPRFLGQSKRREFPQKESSIRSRFERLFQKFWDSLNSSKLSEKKCTNEQTNRMCKTIDILFPKVEVRKDNRSPRHFFTTSELKILLGITWDSDSGWYLYPALGCVNKSPPKPEDVAEVSCAKVLPPKKWSITKKLHTRIFVG